MGYCRAIVLGVTDVSVTVPIWGDIKAIVAAVGVIGGISTGGAIGATFGAIGAIRLKKRYLNVDRKRLWNIYIRFIPKVFNFIPLINNPWTWKSVMVNQNC